MIRIVTAAFAAFCLAYATVPVAYAQDLSPKVIVGKICTTHLENSNSGAKTPERKAKLWRLVETFFDYEGYGTFVGRDAWRNANAEKRQKFITAVNKDLDAMVLAVANIFVKECSITGDKMDGELVRVSTRMVDRLTGDKHNIDFVLQKRSGLWKIADLLVNGSFSQRENSAKEHRKTLVALLQ